MKALLLSVLFLFLYTNRLYSQNFEVILKKGHNGYIEALAFTQDGVYFVTAGSDHTLKLWETKSGLLVRTFSGHNGKVNSFDVNRNYSLLISGSDDRTVKIWDTHTGSCLRTISAHTGWVNNTRFALNDSIIISTSGDWKAGDHWTKYWNAYTGTIIDSVKSRNIFGTDISSDGKFLVCGHGGAPALLFDITRRKLLDTLDGHQLPYRKGDVEAISFSPDDRYIISAGCDYQIKIWDRNAKTYIESLTGHKSTIVSLAVSPDGKYIASVDTENNLNLWDWKNGICIKTLHLDYAIKSLCFRPDGNYLYAGGETLTRWKMPALLPDQNKIIEKMHPESMLLVSSISIKDTILSLRSDGTFCWWDLSVCQPIFIQRDNALQHPQQSVIDPNGRYVATRMFDSIRIWDLHQQKLQKQIAKNAEHNREPILFDPEGKLIYAANSTGIDVFSVNQKNNKIFRHLNGNNPMAPAFFSSSLPTNYSNGIDIDSKGEKIVTANMDGLNLWNLKDGTYAGRLVNERGATFATQDENFGLRLDHGGPVFAVRFSPDSKLIAYGDYDYHVKIRDASTRKLIHTFKGHSAFVNKLCFSTNGRFLASSDWNGKIHIWNINLMADHCSFSGHSMGVNSLAFIQDNRFLLSGGDDGIISVWDMEQATEAIKIVSLERDGYIVICDNYYYTNKKDVANIAFAKGLKVYPIEQMDLKYNRPDIVLSRLGYAPQPMITALRRAYQKRLQKMGFIEDMLSSDFQVPEIKIASANLASQTADSTIRFVLQAVDHQYPLDRLNVFINDVPIYGIKGIDLRPKNTRQHEQTLDLPLSPGENKIQISVLNQAGAESLKETVYVTCTAPVRKPNLYLIGIGVGKFGNPSMNLTYPAKDIKDMAQLFQKNTSATYDNVFVDTILDASLTTDRLKTLKEKLLKTRVDDRVVLFVAGHGIIDDGLDYYFATYHTDFSHPRAKAMPYEAIENLLDSIPARQKLMLMDACHAGEIDKENVVLTKEQRTLHGNVKFRALGNQPTHKQLGLENSFELMKELFVDLRRGTGATIIASAGGVESAMESDLWNNSAFMYALLTGLQEKKADLNKDGAVMVSELQAYLGAEVEKLTEGNQRPTFRAENISNDWRLW